RESSRHPEWSGKRARKVLHSGSWLDWHLQKRETHGAAHQRGAMALVRARAAASMQAAANRPLTTARASAPAAATGAALSGVMPPMATTEARRPPGGRAASHSRRAWRSSTSGACTAAGLVAEA